jgi:hypothetical protein
VYCANIRDLLNGISKHLTSPTSVPLLRVVDNDHRGTFLPLAGLGSSDIARPGIAARVEAASRRAKWVCVVGGRLK